MNVVNTFFIGLFLINYDVLAQHLSGLNDGFIEAQCLTITSRQRPLLISGINNPNNGGGAAGGGANNNIPLARHHIIPASTLTAFFNTALRENRDNNLELAGFMNLLGYLAENALNYYPGVNQLNDYIRQHLLDLRSIQLHYGIGAELPLDRLFDASDVAAVIFYWLPANIFIGPRYRSDDPGNAFEQNARHIIERRRYPDTDLFDTLVRINRNMNNYLQNHEVATFHEVIEILSGIVHEQHEPYPFNENQWEHTGSGHRDGRNVNIYAIRPRDQPEEKRKKRQVNGSYFVKKDPYCLKADETIKFAAMKDNLIIATAIVERTIRHNGFYTRNDYGSWREWYADSSWSGINNSGIYGYGISMAGAGITWNPYGLKFRDGSFVVGILGTDTKYGNDNWVNLVNEDWESTDPVKAGQMYFDKNGRPVAIAITSKFYSQTGAGWSFIYNNGKWEYESTDDWHERRFNRRTTSLDPKAFRFSTGKVHETHDSNELLLL